MLLVQFKKADGTAITLGPLVAIRLDGEELRETEAGPVLAKHHGHRWHVRQEEFLRLDCEGPLSLRFVEAAGAMTVPYGPFSHFSSVDGIGYADHHLFCQIDTLTKRWHLRQDHSEWTTLIVEKR